MIAMPTRLVLNGLRQKVLGVALGISSYRKAPKDFDIITSAGLKEVLKTFHRCEVARRRFPICHVYVDGTVVEVSSFRTSARKSGRYSNHSVRKTPNCNNADYMPWRNCLQRDFTIKALLYTPEAFHPVQIVGKISQPHDTRFSELTGIGFSDSNETLLDEVLNLASSVRASLGKMTAEHFVSQALIEYPQAPQSDLVFIPFALSRRASAIFECVKGGNEKGFRTKNGNKEIDYESLALGRMQERRPLFARIVFDTVYPPKLN